MTSVRGRGRLYRKHYSVAPFVAPSITPPDSFPPPESGDELSDQPARSSRVKSHVAKASTTTSVLKYSEDDLQRILKAVLEAEAPIPISIPAPTPALIVAETPWEKRKVRSPDVYRGKSYVDCYNFCQQCENYFATAETTGLTRTPFAMFFLRDRISFRW